MTTQLPYPVKQMITRQEMAAIIAGNSCHVSRKYDGELARLDLGQSVILAEYMKKPLSGHFYPKSDLEMFRRWPGGWWAALTVLECGGVPCLNLPATARHAMLRGLSAQFTPDIIIADTVTDVDACFAAGAEGVCAVPWGSPFGEILCCKVEDIFTCRVSKVGGTQSVGIVDAATGEARGNVKLGGGAVDQVRVGSIIRCSGMGLTDKNLIRQPTKCREWLVQY